MTEQRKEFDMARRDGTTAKFVFVKPAGSVWYWDMPEHLRSGAPKGHTVSLPLPDVDLDKADSLKVCLDLIGKIRGQDWVGQIVVDLLKPVEEAYLLTCFKCGDKMREGDSYVWYHGDQDDLICRDCADTTYHTDTAYAGLNVLTHKQQEAAGENN